VQQLFTNLTHAVEANAALAIGAALLWGILSILLSPCHLASIPLIVAFLNGQGRISLPRAFALSSLFAFGILLTIAALGALTAAAGRIMGDLGPYANYFVAAVFFLVGLNLLDVIPAPWSGPAQPNMKRRGLLAALALGLIFGIALGPCTFAFMAPVLAVALRTAASNWPYALALLLAYAVGHCAVIALAGASAQLVQRYLNWAEHSRAAVILRRCCGLLVLAVGVYLIYVAP